MTPVAKLVYSAITSVDGYLADDAGKFDWAMPDEEVHTFVNDLERGVGTYLYGRRMYETMRYWEAIDPVGERDPARAGDFAAIWQRCRQGRVLEDARRGLECQDAGRAGLRPGRGAADEGDRRR